MAESFREVLDREKEKQYFKELTEYINQEYATKVIFPPRECVMNAMSRRSPWLELFCKPKHCNSAIS